MKTKYHLLSVLAIGSATAFAGSVSPSFEQPLTPAVPSSEWKVNMTFYGWAQGLKGDIGILNRTAPVDIKFSDILSNLDIAAMGAVEVSHGRWSFLADMTFADISHSVTGPLGGMADVELKQIVGDFIAAYEIVKSDSIKFDVYAGTRVNWIETDLTLTGPLGIITLNGSDAEAWVDPIIGARFRAELPNNFFIIALGDIGGFDVGSQFTWQAVVGCGYHITANSSVMLGYRAIGTDYTDKGFTYDITASGVMLAYSYKF